MPFFDARITHAAASVRTQSEVLCQLRAHKRAKKNAYASRVVNNQRGSFTPHIFSTYGLCGPETTIFLKSLAALFVDKNSNLSYPAVMGVVRIRFTFCLLRWCVTCFCECRSTCNRRQMATSIVNQCRRLLQ